MSMIGLVIFVGFKFCASPCWQRIHDVIGTQERILPISLDPACFFVSDRCT